MFTDLGAGTLGDRRVQGHVCWWPEPRPCSLLGCSVPHPGPGLALRSVPHCWPERPHAVRSSFSQHILSKTGGWGLAGG